MEENELVQCEIADVWSRQNGGMSGITDMSVREAVEHPAIPWAIAGLLGVTFVAMMFSRR